jgi:hypothetical protein
MQGRKLWISAVLGILTFAATVLVGRIAFADDYLNGGVYEQGAYCCCTCGSNGMCTGLVGAWIFTGSPPQSVCRSSTDPVQHCAISNTAAGCP